jgi:hypothetical protein
VRTGVVAPLLALATALTTQCGGSTPSPSSSALSRTSADAAQLPCTAMWQEGVELAGVVGGREAHAYFDMWPLRGEFPVSGIVIFPQNGGGIPLADAPFGLEGPPDAAGCAVQLTRPDGDDVWTLRIESRAQVSGHRRLRDGRVEDIAFRIVPETPCTGAGEWRTFSSPDWPITFDYPAAWAITADHDDVAVECRSVSSLAIGGSWLSFEQGQFKSAGGDIESFTEPYWFSRLGKDDWRVNSWSCPACPPARRSELNGITMLQGAAGEHRMYRPDLGYLGAGSGITRYLFIVGERWVSLDMAGPNGHYDDIGEDGGPVLLDGDAVGDRLVRSIRRR